MPRADRVLSDVIAAGALTEEQAIDILRQVVDGLSELHTLAINYRDLKPDNTLELSGRWCLSDFGISRDLNVATASETMGHLATSAYMAPKVWDRKPNTTIGDLYSPPGPATTRLVVAGLSCMPAARSPTRIRLRRTVTSPLPEWPSFPHGPILSTDGPAEQETPTNKWHALTRKLPRLFRATFMSPLLGGPSAECGQL